MKRVTWFIAVTVLLTALSGQASAQGRSLEEGPIVRRQLLFRSDRVEVAPYLAHTLNDAYRRGAYLALGFNYHLTNAFSLGINVAWGALHYNTNLLDEIEAVNPTIARTLTFSEPLLVGDFHLAYVPIYGKFNILEETTVNYDLHLMGGIAGAMVSSDNVDLEGFKFGPMLGVGFRFFLNGDTAITLDLVDRMYSVVDVARPGVLPEEVFSQQFMIMAGVSFFVTGHLRVSR